MPTERPNSQNSGHFVLGLRCFDDVTLALGTILEKLPQSVWAHHCRDGVEIGLAEVLNNIVEHGGLSAKDARVWVHWAAKPQLHLCVSDAGKPFPNHQIPKTTLPDPDDLCEGGYGWAILGLLCDDITYFRKTHRNRLSLRFSFAEKDKTQ